jgi:hypothetical protein
MSSPAKAGDPVTTRLRFCLGFAYSIFYSVAQGLLDAPLSRGMTDERFRLQNEPLIPQKSSTFAGAEISDAMPGPFNFHYLRQL